MGPDAASGVLTPLQVSSIFVCGEQELAEGDVRQVTTADGRLIAVYNVAGSLYATDDLCTHGEGWLSEGELVGSEIICPLHGGAFDVRNGEATQSPCHIALKTHQVRIENEAIYVLIAP